MSLWTPDGERPVSRTSPADVTAANPQGGTAGAGTPPPELRQALAEAGIDIDRQNDNGATCLMYVASNSKPDLLSLLLERGANPRLANHDDFTALDLAGSLPCLKLLRTA